MRRDFSVVLTVADHDQNGFVALGHWSELTEAEARDFIRRMDDQISDEMEPDNETAAFSFILDLWCGSDCIDNGERILPTQIAMSLAPSQVRAWLDERPDPDSVAMRYRHLPQLAADLIGVRP